MKKMILMLWNLTMTFVGFTALDLMTDDYKKILADHVQKQTEKKTNRPA